MPVLKLNMEGDGCWQDLHTLFASRHLRRSESIEIAVMEKGMTSGKPSVAIRVNLDEGDVVIAETSLALFLSAADAFKGKYGDPRR